jgi:hypothetical protein
VDDITKELQESHDKSKEVASLMGTMIATTYEIPSSLMTSLHHSAFLQYASAATPEEVSQRPAGRLELTLPRQPLPLR